MMMNIDDVDDNLLGVSVSKNWSRKKAWYWSLMPIFSLRVTENKHDELLVQKIVLFSFLVDNDHIYQVNQTLNAMRLDKKPWMLWDWILYSKHNLEVYADAFRDAFRKKRD